MGIIESKIEMLGYKLDTPQPPVGNYLGSKQVGDLLFISGRKSNLTGKVGLDVSEKQAKETARDTVLLILSIVKKDIENLDKIEGVVKLQGFINSSEDFNRLPQVLDGASDLLIELFGANGHHARTATGAAQLPYNATIQLDMILQLKSNN